MIRIIPAIDIIDGKCVRLTHGDFESKKIYNSDPVSVAKQFEDAGIKFLHIVDLDGARQGKIVNHHVLQKISKETRLHIDFGGGVQSDEDLKIAFDSGSKQVTAGSIIIKNESLALSWLEQYGTEKIILGADVKNGHITISGWQEQSSITLMSFLNKYASVGFTTTICTDVSRDGALTGPAIDLYNSIKNEIPGLKVVASGGVSKIDDVIKLNENGIDGVIIGKALYEGKIKIKELKPFLC